MPAQPDRRVQTNSFRSWLLCQLTTTTFAKC
jgi:hypothetical protein